MLSSSEPIPKPFESDPGFEMLVKALVLYLKAYIVGDRGTFFHEIFHQIYGPVGLRELVIHEGKFPY